MRKREKYLKNRRGEDVVKISFNVGKCEVCNVNVATVSGNVIFSAAFVLSLISYILFWKK